MVLETILNPANAKQKFWHILIISIVYTLIAIITAKYLFPGTQSIVFIGILSMIFIPFFQKMFEKDEINEDMVALHKIKGNIFSRHSQTIKSLSMFFLGVTLAVGVVYAITSDYETIFEEQNNTLESFATGNFSNEGSFGKFLANNTRVMIIVFVLSIAFGAGSILILAWNASVLGVYLGLIIRALTENGVPHYAAVAYGLPAGLAAIALHGIPEIYAYFVAGLAGGILSFGHC